MGRMKEYWEEVALELYGAPLTEEKLDMARPEAERRLKEMKKTVKKRRVVSEAQLRKAIADYIEAGGGSYFNGIDWAADALVRLIPKEDRQDWYDSLK